ncbi:MAG TPA: carboxypeptidase regulatory-like domain-containing protein [Polyangiaceae bacterium]|nr:carboxypeptidase regulatory-like domain-containing protein [Polyangiaceae bacterium]
MALPNTSRSKALRGLLGIVILCCLVPLLFSLCQRRQLQPDGRPKSTVSQPAFAGRTEPSRVDVKTDDGGESIIRSSAARGRVSGAETDVHTPESEQVSDATNALLTGTVVDAMRRGMPIPGAVILIDDPIAPTASAIADREGLFQLPVTAGEVQSLIVRATGYRFARWFRYEIGELVRDENGIVCPLLPGAILRGRVIDNHGESVDSGSVIAFDADGWRGLSPVNRKAARMHHDTETFEPLKEYDLRSSVLYKMGGPNWLLTGYPFAPLDKEGEFVIPDLPADEPVYLYVQSQSVQRHFESITLHEGEEREIELSVQLAPVIQGTVTSPISTAILNPGAWICVHERHGQFSVGEDRWAPIDKKGHFSSGPLWPTTEAKIYVTYETRDSLGLLHFYEQLFTTPLGAEEVVQLQFTLDGVRELSVFPERIRER